MFQVLVDGIPETLMLDPVGGVSSGWHETACEFVLTLGARLEPLQVIFNAILNTGIVANLEVQAVIVLIATPVTPV